MYQIELFYGYEDREDGIYHAFQAEDPSAKKGDKMGGVLSAMLDLEPNDPCFRWDSMYISLPDSVVENIRSDVLKECRG